MAWIDKRRDGLGDQLEAEFYAAVSVVQDRPYSFAADHTGYRVSNGSMGGKNTC